MARYGLRLTAGRGRSNWIFNDTILMSLNATGLSFYNVAPVARAGAYTQTYATADKTINSTITAAVATTAATSTTPFGYTGAAQADDIVSNLNEARADILDLYQAVNAIVDDLQAYGLLQ